MIESPYAFRWKCSAFGTVWYLASGDGEPYEIEVRRFASDHERRIFNGDEVEWRRDVLGAIDLLRRSSWPDRPLPAELVAAFNAWLLAEHERHVRLIKAHPDRYGDVSDDDPLLAPPRPVRGARYVVGSGWAVEEDPTASPAP